MNEDTKSPATVPLAPVSSPTPVQAAPAVDVVPPPASSPEPEQAVADTSSAPSQPSSQPQPRRVHAAPVMAISIAILVCIILCGFAYWAYTKG